SDAPDVQRRTARRPESGTSTDRLHPTRSWPREGARSPVGAVLSHCENSAVVSWPSPCGNNFKNDNGTSASVSKHSLRNNRCPKSGVQTAQFLDQHSQKRLDIRDESDRLKGVTVRQLGHRRRVNIDTDSLHPG